MFYSGNDNYMQDLYFYNQNPNNTYSMNGVQNGMYMNQNMAPNNNGIANINNLYPSLYRILMPVVSRVVQNSNFQFLNEDVLNNITDTIYNIVEGQIEYDDNPSNNNDNISNNNSSSGSSQNRGSESRPVNTQNSQRNNTSRSNESLLRDIIKILVLKEIMARNMYQMQMNNMQLFNMNY